MDTKKTYQLTIFVPTPVWDMFQKRVRDHRFQGVGFAVYYLLESYRKQYRGEKISSVMRKILKRSTEDWFVLFRYDGRSQSAISVDRNWATEIMSISQQAGYKDRSRLAAVLIGAFVSSPRSLLKKMAIEMDQRTIDVSSNTEVLSTYISFYQYAVLGIVAKRMNKTISGLLLMLLDVILKSEDKEAELMISGEIRDLINDILIIKGYTVKDFRREKDINISIASEERRMNILILMKKYDIPTPCEFLRRLVMFFLNAQYVLFKNGNKFLICDERAEEYEDTLFSKYSRNEYAANNLSRF